MPCDAHAPQVHFTHATHFNACAYGTAHALIRLLNKKRASPKAASQKKRPTPEHKKKPLKKKTKMVIRKRKNTTLTLSDEVKHLGGVLAQHRGLPFARLVESILRDELRRAGLLPDSATG